MSRWNLQIIAYQRDGGIEAEAINAGIVGVGETIFEAMDSFQKMASALAVMAYKSGADLTYQSDAEDSVLFGNLEAGTIGQEELASQSIVAFGSFGLELEHLDAASKARFEGGKLELLSGAA